MRKIIIATPSMDGKVESLYTLSLHYSTLACLQNDIQLVPIFVLYDSLVQRARNDLFKMCYNAMQKDAEITDMIFIDADMGWKPEHIMQLISCDKDIIGGTARKKNPYAEEYVIKIKETDNILVVKDNLIEVSGLGTGFLKVSRKAVMELYESTICKEYKQGDIVSKMIFDIGIEEDGQLISEDISFCNKLKQLGYSLYLDPFITCDHVGTMTFSGDLVQWAKANRLIDFV